MRFPNDIILEKFLKDQALNKKLIAEKGDFEIYDDLIWPLTQREQARNEAKKWYQKISNLNIVKMINLKAPKIIFLFGCKNNNFSDYNTITLTQLSAIEV